MQQNEAQSPDTGTNEAEAGAPEETVTGGNDTPPAEDTVPAETEEPAESEGGTDSSPQAA